MSDKPFPKRPPNRPFEVIKAGPYDPVECARLEELNKKHDHNRDVVMHVLDHVEDSFYAGKRDLVSVIIGLLAHLTPEQALALAEKLPAHLPTEAAARLAGASKGAPALNGVGVG
ncbi:MAG: hypothetical protein K2W96_26900 [Gemmataceae bacterium]|nr:hypothetical protein [Gemmataceae bacterium]